MVNRLLVISGLVLIVAVGVAVVMGDAVLTAKLLLSILSFLPIFLVINLVKNKSIIVVIIVFAVIQITLCWLLI